MAKKFKFRLQKVLDYRALITKQRKKELLEKNQRLHALEEKKEQILHQLTSPSRSNIVDGGTKELYLEGDYAKRLRKELEETEQGIVKAKKEQVEALLRYQEAAKEEKALLKLKERKLNEYKEGLLKSEIDFLDEIGTQKGNNQYKD